MRECLTMRLASLRGQGNPPAGAVASGAVGTSGPHRSTATTPPSAVRAAVWIGTGLVAVMVVAAGGVLVVRNPRRRYGACRTCGVKLAERVDLCQPCRHEAADALRRVAAERADHARLQEDEQRRQAAREVEQQLALEEEARRQQLEEAQKEQTRQDEERARRQRDDEARQQPQIDVSATQDEFDPYAVLGLPHDASSADVDAAYKTCGRSSIWISWPTWAPVAKHMKQSRSRRAGLRSSPPSDHSRPRLRRLGAAPPTTKLRRRRSPVRERLFLRGAE